MKLGQKLGLNFGGSKGSSFLQGRSRDCRDPGSGEIESKWKRESGRGSGKGEKVGWAGRMMEMFITGCRRWRDEMGDFRIGDRYVPRLLAWLG